MNSLGPAIAPISRTPGPRGAARLILGAEDTDPRRRILLMNSDEIHLWNGRMAAEESCLRELRAFLSQDEIEKADRLRFDSDKRSYIICRGLLRTILAAYLELKPGEIQFQYNAQGKPFLRNQAIRFSVSHSAERVLCAFCKNFEVGVDLERVREMPDASTLAQRFFAPSEYTELCEAGPANRTTVFFCCWTRKEAYIKATGQGLSLPLNSFQVPTAPEAAGKLRIMMGPNAPLDSWTLRHLDPAPGYVGALAASLPYVSLVERTFETAENCIRRAKVLRGPLPLSTFFR